MKRIPKAKREECVRLRVTEQLSTPTIARRVGISNFSAYRILAKQPWIPLWAPDKGGARATWSRSEVATLTRMWATADEAEIIAALPGRRWASIARKACGLKLRRRQPASRRNKRFVHRLCEELRTERERQALTRPQVSEMTGYHFNQILAWELGKTTPKLNYLEDWAKALGFTLKLERATDATVRVPDKSRLMASR